MNGFMQGLLGPALMSKTGIPGMGPGYSLSNTEGASEPKKAGLLGNPMFGIAMGLLAASQDRKINPFQSAMDGAYNAKQYEYVEEKRRREEEDRKRMEKAREHLSQVLKSPYSGQYNPMLASNIEAATSTEEMLRAMQLNEKMQGGDGTTSMRDFLFRQGLSGEDAELWDRMHARSQSTPAIIQEQQWLNDPARTPEEIDQYWQSKRANQMYTVGNVPYTRDPAGGTAPLATPDEVAQNLQQQKAAQAVGQSQGEAQAKLNPFALEVEATLQATDQLRQHPGREGATGKSGWFNPIFPPGSDRRDFLTKLETIGGKQFAIAYETLKGGGTITEVETEQATRALGNLTTAQSDEQFKQALDEFDQAVIRGYQKLEAQAGVPPEQLRYQSDTEVAESVLQSPGGVSYRIIQ